MQIAVPVLAKAYLECNLWVWCGIVRESLKNIQWP